MLRGHRRSNLARAPGRASSAASTARTTTSIRQDHVDAGFEDMLEAGLASQQLASGRQWIAGADRLDRGHAGSEHSLRQQCRHLAAGGMKPHRRVVMPSPLARSRHLSSGGTDGIGPPPRGGPRGWRSSAPTRLGAPAGRIADEINASSGGSASTPPANPHSQGAAEKEDGGGYASTALALPGTTRVLVAALRSKRRVHGGHLQHHSLVRTPSRSFNPPIVQGPNGSLTIQTSWRRRNRSQGLQDGGWPRIFMQLAVPDQPSRNTVARLDAMSKNSLDDPDFAIPDLADAPARPTWVRYQVLAAACSLGDRGDDLGHRRC